MPTQINRTSSPTQRVRELTKERDSASADVRAVRGTLSTVSDLVFGEGSDADVLRQVKELLLGNWEHTQTPGKSFDLMRRLDKSGVSGTGRVAEGFEFEDGTVALRWLGDDASTNVYQSVESMLRIHGHGGSTEVQYR
jgi:hypothetical protein